MFQNLNFEVYLIIYKNKGNGLVAAITDLGSIDWNSAKTACDELILNGYSDWHLPTIEELNALYDNLQKSKVGGFGKKWYWSSTDYRDVTWGDDNHLIKLFVHDGKNEGNVVPERRRSGAVKPNIRAVRAF